MLGHAEMLHTFAEWSVDESDCFWYLVSQAQPAQGLTRALTWPMPRQVENPGAPAGPVGNDG